MQPLYESVEKAGLKPGRWAIVGQPITKDGVLFFVVRKIAAAGIRALVQADREDRGDM